MGKLDASNETKPLADKHLLFLFLSSCPPPDCKQSSHDMATHGEPRTHLHRKCRPPAVERRLAERFGVCGASSWPLVVGSVMSERRPGRGGGTEVCCFFVFFEEGRRRRLKPSDRSRKIRTSSRQNPDHCGRWPASPSASVHLALCAKT